MSQLRIFNGIKKADSGHDLTWDAKATLQCVEFHYRFLQVRNGGCVNDGLQRVDVPITTCCNQRDARKLGLTVDQDGTTSADSSAAAGPNASKCERIPEGVDQDHVVVLYEDVLAVYSHTNRFRLIPGHGRHGSPSSNDERLIHQRK